MDRKSKGIQKKCMNYFLFYFSLHLFFRKVEQSLTETIVMFFNSSIRSFIEDLMVTIFALYLKYLELISWILLKDTITKE